MITPGAQTLQGSDETVRTCWLDKGQQQVTQ